MHDPRIIIFAFLIIAWTGPGQAITLSVTDEAGEAIARVMVSQQPGEPMAGDFSDDGYTPHGVSNKAATTITRFTDAAGIVKFNDTNARVAYRARAQGFTDVFWSGSKTSLVMTKLPPGQLADSYPANVWLSQLHFGTNQDLKKSFLLNCAFCHQQASAFMRAERSEEQWLAIIERMNVYGSRLPNAYHQEIARSLNKEYRRLRENPQLIPAPRRWQSHLSGVTISEWPLGDGFSQLHDLLLHPNGKIYIGDNLQDRIYEIDPASGEYSVYKIPHDKDARLGGFLGNRFSTFPKLNNYLGVHSFAYSKQDGNIFITPSMQQALLEFNPRSKEFTLHKMPGGFYPHTIRIDAQDRVWFTLALSSQVAMFDRKKQSFKLYALPARGVKEWLILKSLPLLFDMEPASRPTPDPDPDNNGLPMPYGIDVAPDGGIWVARLYANDIAHINPDTDDITMIDFPFQGPRRLRVDAQGNVWIVAFQDSLLVKYDPVKERFSKYELPVINEVPYALNVDRKRRLVWVNGNQSDSVMAFDIAAESWRVYPLPKQRFFSRDIEIDERDGSIYTTNSHFPAWQIEGGQPTLLHISTVPPAAMLTEP